MQIICNVSQAYIASKQGLSPPGGGQDGQRSSLDLTKTMRRVQPSSASNCSSRPLPTASRKPRFLVQARCSAERNQPSGLSAKVLGLAAAGLVSFTDFERNLADKISKFGEEPSSASVTCAITGPIVIKDPSKIRGKSGEDVFSEKKGLGFIKNKTLHVRRIFDETHKSLLYIAYSTRLVQDSKGESPGRYKTSICALPISSAVTKVEKTDSNVSSGLFQPVKNDSA